MARSNTAAISIQISDVDVAKFKRFFKAAGESDAPYLRAALERSGNAFTSEIRVRAVGGIAGKVKPLGVKGTGAGLRFAGKVDHPGARSMEFGRIYWTAKGVKRKHPPGQEAKPYLGVKTGGAATGAVRDDIENEIFHALTAEYERIMAGGS